MRRFIRNSATILISMSLLLFNSQSSNADQLSEAQSKLRELQSTLDNDNQFINVDYPRYYQQSQECIQKFQNSTIAEEISQRDSCTKALSRFDSDKAMRIQRIAEIQVAISTLELEFAKLRTESSSNSVPSGTSSTSNSASTNSNTSQNASTPAPTPMTDSSGETSKSTTTTKNNSESNQPTLPTKISESPRATTPQTPNVASKNQPVAAATNAPVKKRTITCIKGKTVRKVTAVKPICPKGFKLKK